ncbi:hypothetical protein PsorP6_015466 [Peronosclerospora sorghi]|uniref:Uncharacterized protein n=1 Tax=Peronosclerospora sorghi TaxID=230839 RepID=A0ACC0WQZ4_9STRA|nr:hypothetical protein PsorP6_015466 [Peronosclerospora sorghi]
MRKDIPRDGGVGPGIVTDTRIDDHSIGKTRSERDSSSEKSWGCPRNHFGKARRAVEALVEYKENVNMNGQGNESSGECSGVHCRLQLLLTVYDQINVQGEAFLPWDFFQQSRNAGNPLTECSLFDQLPRVE